MRRARGQPRRSPPPPPRDPGLSASAAHLCAVLTWVVAALYAAALLAVIAGPHRIGDVFAETDFYGAYAQGARALLHGHLDPSRYGVVGPGYEVALAALGAVIPNLFLAAELLSIAAMVTGLLLWARLVSRRADPRLGLVMALFLAVNSTFFRYGYSVTNDAPAFALQAGALALLLGGATARSALLAGGLAALAFLTRYNAVALLPAGLVAILARGTLHPDRRKAALLYAAGFLALVAPWIGFSLASGQSFSFQFHHNIAYDVFARARGIPWDEYQRVLQPQFKSLADVIARDPGAVARREAFNVWDHLALDARHLLGMPVALCALAGLVFVWADRALHRLWPVAVAAGLFFLTLVPVFYSERYSIPLLPAYAILAAAPFASSRLAPPWFGAAGPWVKTALAAVPLAFALETNLRETRFALEQLPIEVLECARTLRAEARPGDRILCRKPHIAFHGGVEPVGFPFAKNLAELAASARKSGARWIYFSWPEAEMRRPFAYLLDTSAVVPGLVVRHATAPRPAVLYEIAPGFGTDPVWLANDTLRVWHTMRARLRMNPADAEALFELGAIAFDRENYAEARAGLERGLAEDPRYLAGWMLLGETCLFLKDPGGAEQAYGQALAIEPGSVEARVGLGWASLAARRPTEAADRWRPVVGLTRDPHALERMAALFQALGDPVAAAQARAGLARQAGAGR